MRDLIAGRLCTPRHTSYTLAVTCLAGKHADVIITIAGGARRGRGRGRRKYAIDDSSSSDGEAPDMDTSASSGDSHGEDEVVEEGQRSQQDELQLMSGTDAAAAPQTSAFPSCSPSVVLLLFQAPVRMPGKVFMRLLCVQMFVRAPPCLTTFSACPPLRVMIPFLHQLLILQKST